MKRIMLRRNNSLVITALISVSFMLLCWLISPVLPMGAPHSEIFNKVWQTVNDNFYDPNFNGVNWKAMRSKYAPQVTSAQSNVEAAAVINQMLSELKTSHTRFYTPDEPAYYQVLGIFEPRIPNLRKQLQKFFPQGKIEYSGIGIFTKDINGKTFVSAILDGFPAASSGLMVGDQLLGVDNRPFQPIQSFAGKAGQKVKLLIQRSQDPATQQEIVVTPKLLDASTMFLDAMKASTQVIERQGKKIGYVHIWSYAGDQYQPQLEEDLFYGRLKNADALVLDLREGWGGAPLSALNIYTARGPSVTSIRRDGTKFTDIAHWNKPVVMLVNEGSRSAKEILAYSFQQYDIGPVVGAKTAGAVVAGTAFLMPDGSLLYLAVADVYVDGNQRLEGKGVIPDVMIPFSLEYARGADPQKERGLEVALAAVQQQK
ncbi:MAG: S41 family peptidase [Aphanothece sp. CMT-3BRIN-NPC111]|jgi:carboxyl-terminal processing protease|nr:S41 family peptidase [Aphanothece sp. CMT-3BRIN-NPC111]